MLRDSCLGYVYLVRVRLSFHSYYFKSFMNTFILELYIKFNYYAARLGKICYVTEGQVVLIGLAMVSKFQCLSPTLESHIRVITLHLINMLQGYIIFN